VVPVTAPVLLLTVTELLLHAPPVGPDNVMLPPGQMLPVPVMVAGSALTVTGIVLAQPVPASV